MDVRSKVIVAGILDTKGNEIRFIADRICAMGGDPTILELSVGRYKPQRGSQEERSANR